MGGTVKIAGHQFKTWQVGVVGVGGAVVTYLVWRAHASAAAGSATGSANAIDPATGLPVSQDNVPDPLTGEGYLAEAQQYGSVSAAEAAASSGASYNTSGYGYGAVGGTSAGVIGDYGTTLGVTSGTGYASNADWDQAVTAGLSSIGYSASDVSSAIGRYLGGLSLTADQQNIVSTAIGEYGPPPVGSFSIIAAPATGTATSGDTTTTTGTGTTTTTGTGTGTGSTSSGSTAGVTATVSGGHVISHNNNDVEVGWTGHNAVKYKVTLTFEGSENGRSNTITGTTASYSGLPSKHTGHVTVTPYNAAGAAGPSGTIDISTT